MFRWFERFSNPFPETEITQPPSRLGAFFSYYTRGFKKPLAALAFFTICVAVIEVVLFSFLGNLVDWLSSRDPASFVQEEQARLWGMAVLVLVGLPLAVVMHSMLFHQTLFVNYTNAVRWQAHQYLLEQGHAFYQQGFAGRLATKVLQTSEAVRETVMKLLDVLLYVLVYLAGMTALIIAADWRLSLPLLGWALCYLYLLCRQVPKLRHHAQIQADAQSQLTGRMVDSYSHFHTVKLFSHAEREAGYMRRAMEQLLEAVYPLLRRVTALNISLWLFNALLIFATAALAIALWTQGDVSTGAIAVAMALTLRMKSLSQFIMWEIAALFRNLGTVQDGMATLSQPRSVVDSRDAQTLAVSEGAIELQQVSFAYQATKPVFENLSLQIGAGERVGIVGSSGAGKSTLISLLLRLHDLDEGQILIDGQNIAQVSQRSLRAQIGVVSQEPGLLYRSVRENLMYGRPDASEAEMRAAARAAHAEEFILGLTDPDGRTGYDASVGEQGVKLSGGQRQRLAIARVLLKNAPVLILDEATSALDSDVEAAIQSSLAPLMENKTVIAIAHRLSTIAAMDRLIVLEQGRVVEQGTHQALLRKQGRYAQLWARQSGGFIY